MPRRHHVTFESPGTLFNEMNVQEIDAWDPWKACEMARNVVERYNARPFVFYFTTEVYAPDVEDSEGGTLRVQPREVQRSGRYFLGGTVLTFDELEERGDERDRILLDNMRSNDWPLVIENATPYRSVHPFGEHDVVVRADAYTLDAGDEAGRVAYRKRLVAQWQAERERTIASMRKQAT